MSDDPRSVSSKEQILIWLRDADMCVKLAACGESKAFVNASRLIGKAREALSGDSSAPETGNDELALTRAKLERLQRWAAKAGHFPECSHWKPWTQKGCTCGLVDLMLGLPSAEETSAPPKPRGCTAHDPYNIPACADCRAVCASYAMSASEAASFDKALARSPRRVEDTLDRNRDPAFVGHELAQNGTAPR